MDGDSAAPPRHSSPAPQQVPDAGQEGRPAGGRAGGCTSARLTHSFKLCNHCIEYRAYAPNLCNVSNVWQVSALQGCIRTCRVFDPLSQTSITSCVFTPRLRLPCEPKFRPVLLKVLFRGGAPTPFDAAHVLLCVAILDRGHSRRSRVEGGGEVLQLLKQGMWTSPGGLENDE